MSEQPIAECIECFEEEGSLACVRPAHKDKKFIDERIKDILRDQLNKAEQEINRIKLVDEPEPILAVVNDTLGLEALHDIVIVLEDKFKTGYECPACDGEGHTIKVCLRCKGSKLEEIDDKCTVCEGTGRVADLFRPHGSDGLYVPGLEKTKKCSHCSGSGKDPDFDKRKLQPGLYPCRACMTKGPADHISSSGFVQCEKCHGVGSALVVPENTTRRPNSGKVVAIGPGHYNVNGVFIPTTLKPGQRLLYSNHAGFAIEFKRNVVLRYMREEEVAIRMHGIGDVRKELA